MILMLTTKYEEPLILWLQQFMEQALDSFRQALSSTYLQNKLVEAKIECFVKFTARLYDYGTDKLRKCVRDHIFLPQINQILSRFNDSLLDPLSRSEFVPSEQDRFNAAFKYVPIYAKMIGMAIQMIHLHENRSENAIEASIKNILQKALKIASPQTDESLNEWPFGNYLLQYIIFEAL